MARKKNIEQQPSQKMRQLQVQPFVEVGEVAIYNPDDTIRLEVRLEQEMSIISIFI
ncbi:MAG: hypothetical protein II841_06355 [Bacteroidales bacterium]|nr:hypothetical protein [Bacteroidales bacterium]